MVIALYCCLENNIFNVKKISKQDKIEVGYACVSAREQNLDLQIDAFAKAGMRKVFYGTGGPGTGTLVMQLFCVLAEHEQIILREITQAGLSSARARGHVGEDPRACHLDMRNLKI